MRDSPALAPARRIAQQFGLLEQVEAVALSGSRSSETSDQRSDIDLYVYVTQPIALEARRQIAAGATRAEIGNEFWEPGDEWIDGESGIAVDVMYREVNWIRDQIRRVLVRSPGFHRVHDLFLVQRVAFESTVRPVGMVR